MGYVELPARERRTARKFLDSHASDLMQRGAIEGEHARRTGDEVTIHFARTTWRSSEELTPARAMVLYIGPEGRVEERSRLGGFTR
jgi:hypothetical protein